MERTKGSIGGSMEEDYVEEVKGERTGGRRECGGRK